MRYSVVMGGHPGEKLLAGHGVVNAVTLHDIASIGREPVNFLGGLRTFGYDGHLHVRFARQQTDFAALSTSA